MRSRLYASALASGITLSLTAIAPTVLAAQEHSLRVWWVPQAEPIGLQSSSGHSQPMLGASLLLLYRRPESRWSLGVSLGGMFQASPARYGQFASSVAGITAETRRVLGRGSVQPYIVGSLFAGTLRVDDVQPIGEGLSIYGGSDATTAIVGVGAGAEAGIGRFRFFLDMQYNWRSNGIYGRSGVPLRLGLHF